MYVITPHGGEFVPSVEVRIPVPNVTLLPTQKLVLAKAQPGGQWELLDTQIVDGKLTTQVNSFSIFATMVVNYPLPVLQAVPFAVTISIDCGQQDCQRLFGPATLQVTAAGNGGQLPEICRNQTPQLQLVQYGSGWDGFEGVTMPLPTLTATYTTSPTMTGVANFGIYLNCGSVLAGSWWKHASWDHGDPFPSLSIRRMPPSLDVVEGLQADLDALLMGGAVGQRTSDINSWAFPTSTDRAIVEWQRSDDGGSSWRAIAHSYQDEANRTPFGTGQRWYPWGVRHGFIATATDQGALIRIHACYAPPAPATPPPCVTSSPTRINVIQHSSLPAIIESPRSVLIRTTETANFSVNVSGLPAPTLQWQTRPANSTGEWTHVSLGTGATSNNFTTAPRTLADNGEQYRVIATNAVGSVASTPVTVSVSEQTVAPSITTQPASLSVINGGDAVFAAMVYGTEALSYQWRFNGTNIDGANSPILRLTQVTNANAGNYSLYASNAAGNVTSNAATLHIAAAAPAAVPPTIVTQPASVVANVGNTATFAVGVDGTGPLTFQWRRDGVNIPGANRASLTFSSVALPNAGTYSVVVSNSAGAVVSGTVTLDVHPEVGVISPSITSQPSTVIVPAGGSAMLAVGATGSGPLSYQWSFNGVAIPGATLPVLTLNNVGNSNVGDYTVTVTNSVSSTVSAAAQLILLGAPVITQDPTATTVVQGISATFSVSANGSGLHYQWLRNGNQIPGATEASYSTPSLVEADSGAVYSVMVYNGAGMVTSQGAVLTVQVVIAPSVLQHPASATIEPGQTAPLCTSIGGTTPIHVELRRWLNGVWAPYLITGVGDGETGQTFCYSSPALQLADSGAQFRFFASNAAGEVMSDIATLTVSAPPPPGITQTTLVSVTLAGGTGDYGSRSPSVSADGRYVAFLSNDWNLVPGFPDSPSLGTHAYLRDLATGTTTLIDRPMTGMPSTRSVSGLELSSNGRYAIFATDAGDLVEGDTNEMLDVFRRDLVTGTTVRLSTLPNGNQLEGGGGGGYDARLSVSGDGRWVTFMSPYDMTGDGSDTGGYLMYVRDAESNYRRHFAGAPGQSPIGWVAVSDDGAWIAYAPSAVLPAPQTINLYDIEREMSMEVYRFEQSSTAWLTPGISISADGRYVAFAMKSVAVTGVTSSQVMVADRLNPGTATIVSTSTNGAADGDSSWPHISGDGRYVLFSTYARNLTERPNSSAPYLVLRDLVGGVSTPAGHSVNGAIQPLSTSGGFDGGATHAISRDASTIAFVPGDQVYAEPRR